MHQRRTQKLCFHVLEKETCFSPSPNFSALSSTKEDKAWTFCIDLSVKGKKGNPYAAFSYIQVPFMLYVKRHPSAQFTSTLYDRIVQTSRMNAQWSLV